ncbi:response regulator [Streptomyces sp. NPDC056600]|uniref:response regulator n=1 Tax=Streptomyces sp. NPDC056600 TaxID=3345874 RepID=UPI0036906E00
MTAPPRVVIADDQALVRTGFRMILAADGIDVVAEVADGLEAVEAVRRTRPDVVLMDVRMPRLDGLEATRRVLAATDTGAGAGIHVAPHADPTTGAYAPRVIILTTFDLDEFVYAALSAGASGFLLKDVTPEHLVAAVRLVRSGDALLAPAITRRLVERYARSDAGAAASAGAGSGAPARHATGAPAPAPAPALHRDLAVLTPRELEVLRLLAQGRSNAELARHLHLAETTVKTHVGRVLAKLHLRDRVQAVVLAYETGLVGPAGPPPGP